MQGMAETEHEMVTVKRSDLDELCHTASVVDTLRYACLLLLEAMPFSENKDADHLLQALRIMSRYQDVQYKNPIMQTYRKDGEWLREWIANGRNYPELWKNVDGEANG